jgi:hypothetical protein
MDDLTLGVKVVQALENLQEGRGSVRPRLYRRVSTLREHSPNSSWRTPGTMETFGKISGILNLLSIIITNSFSVNIL